MPLNSLTLENLNKEYLSKISILRINQADACYAFGTYSCEKEEYDIEIYKLFIEYKERIKTLF